MADHPVQPLVAAFCLAMTGVTRLVEGATEGAETGVTDVVVVGVVGLGRVVGFLRVALRVRGDRGDGDACVVR